MFTLVASVVGTVIAVILLAGFLPRLLGVVRISEDQVGVVVKKFATKKLPAGSIIALNGEAGYQADTLAPGLYFGLYPWQFQIEKYPLTVIPPGDIGLIMAIDGSQIPNNRILAQTIDCDNFQSARKFLANGGQKGRQTAILTAGKYRINPALFTVVTRQNAEKFGLDPHLLEVLGLEPQEVGIVTTLDGAPIAEGEIAGIATPGHDNYQSVETFLANGGKRGLQEQVLLSGTWNINPWFARIERVGMTDIPIGYVGVVISYVGKEHIDISGDAFKHGDLVEKGHKGVWAEPLYPGKHPLNPRTVKIELVPTTNIALNWANNRTEAHKLDANLNSIKVRSKDGFSITLDVTQIIHIGAKEASKVISRFGNMANLVNQVLEPAIGNYFRNSAQDYSVLDFLATRAERQKDALKFIREALQGYDVEAPDTYIGDLVPPESLMQTLTDRKLAQEQKSTYQVQEEAQKQRQTLVNSQALADIQGELVKKEQSVRMEEYQANAAIKRAEGEARSIELRAKADSESARMRGEGEAKAIEAKGLATASAYKAGVDAMGQDNFGSLQVVNAIGERGIKVVPDFLVTGGSNDGGSNGMMMSAFMGSLLKEHVQEDRVVKAKPVAETKAPKV